MTTSRHAAWRTATLLVAVLWAVTIASLFVVATVVPLHRLAGVTLVRLGLDLEPRAPTLHELLVTRFATNVRVALLPVLLVAAGASRRPAARAVADLTIAGTLTLNTLLVGAALGVHGVRLLPWLPHLPLEWGAFACCTAPWLIARRNPSARARELLAPVAVGLFLLAAAAVLETYATPRP